MTLSVRTPSSQAKSGLGRFIKIFAVGLALALPVAAIVASEADARVGRGMSSGSRGSRTFTAPPSTATAPNAGQPFNRTITQPGVNTPAATAANPAAAKGGLLGGLSGRGLLGGLAAGFLGAGLFGMLFGGGFLSGLGSFAGILGMLLQIALVVIVARLAWGWWQRRQASNYAGAAAGGGPAPDAYARQAHDERAPPQGGGFGGFGFGKNAAPKPIDITPDDYNAFEQLLGDVQTAWSNEDVNKLHTLATPEMVSYFAQDLAENNSRGVVNKVTNVKLLQGDLAEAWREGNTDYATVALRFGLVDKTTDKATGRVVDGSDEPQEATEIWTFARRPGEAWELSAIQQA
jgi:predicted lipid-binding transport protein (Tim44 family)